MHLPVCVLHSVTMELVLAPGWIVNPCIFYLVFKRNVYYIFEIVCDCILLTLCILKYVNIYIQMYIYIFLSFFLWKIKVKLCIESQRVLSTLLLFLVSLVLWELGLFYMPFNLMTLQYFYFPIVDVVWNQSYSTVNQVYLNMWLVLRAFMPLHNVAATAKYHSTWSINSVSLIMVWLVSLKRSNSSPQDV